MRICRLIWRFTDIFDNNETKKKTNELFLLFWQLILFHFLSIAARDVLCRSEIEHEIAFHHLLVQIGDLLMGFLWKIPLAVHQWRRYSISPRISIFGTSLLDKSVFSVTVVESMKEKTFAAVEFPGFYFSEVETIAFHLFFPPRLSRDSTEGRIRNMWSGLCCVWHRYGN